MGQMQQNTIFQPEDMAKLHAQSGLEQRPWTAQEFAQLCAAENSLMIEQDFGFALGRVIHTEVELLLLIVSRAKRKQGLGKTYLQLFEEAARQRGAKNCFLEVGAENTAARALYQKCGYAEQGLRKGYYRKMNCTREDALVLAKTLA